MRVNIYSAMASKFMEQLELSLWESNWKEQ
jgi:hypothetical protein